MHPTNRGVALYGERVYMATVDAHLVALDARTGKVVWDQKVEDYTHGYYSTLAPLAAQGLDHGRRLGRRVRHPRLRRRVRRRDRRARLEDLHHSRLPASRAATPGPARPGRPGGVPVWITGALRPGARAHLLGHRQRRAVDGRHAPWRQPVLELRARARRRRPGSSPAGTSTTGTTRGTGTRSRRRCSSTTSAAARTIHGLVHPAATATCGSSSAPKDAIGFVDAQPYVHQNVFTKLDPKTGRPEYDLAHKPVTGQARRVLSRRRGAGRTGRRRRTARRRGCSTSRRTRTSARWLEGEPVAVPARAALHGHRARAGRGLDLVLAARRGGSHRRDPGLERRRRAGEALDADLQEPELGTAARRRAATCSSAAARTTATSAPSTPRPARCSGSSARAPA